MSWGETLALFRVLAGDPTSQVAVAVHAYAYPLSREGFMLADLYDVTLAANWNGKRTRPKPYPRPTDKGPKRLGDTGGRTRAQVLAILAEHRDGTPTPAGPAHPTRDARGRFVRRPRPNP